MTRISSRLPKARREARKIFLFVCLCWNTKAWKTELLKLQNWDGCQATIQSHTGPILIDMVPPNWNCSVHVTYDKQDKVGCTGLLEWLIGIISQMSVCVFVYRAVPCCLVLGPEVIRVVAQWPGLWGAQIRKVIGVWTQYKKGNWPSSSQGLKIESRQHF